MRSVQLSRLTASPAYFHDREKQASSLPALAAFQIERRQLVSLPYAPGEAGTSAGIGLRRAFFGQGAQVQPHFPMVSGDQIGNQVGIP